jgi:hypothetical protein
LAKVAESLRGGADQIESTPGRDANNTSQIAEGAMRRYRDGYMVARAMNGMGNIVKFMSLFI